MTRIIFAVLFSAFSLTACWAQSSGKQWSDLNYAGDDKAYHNLDMIALLNPITFLDKTDPPFLVIHGAADAVVPYCQSELFANALKEKGVLNEFVSVPEGQHGPVTFNENTFRKMTDFFLKEAEIK